MTNLAGQTDARETTLSTPEWREAVMARLVRLETNDEHIKEQLRQLTPIVQHNAQEDKMIKAVMRLQEQNKDNNRGNMALTVSAISSVAAVGAVILTVIQFFGGGGG